MAEDMVAPAQRLRIALNHVIRGKAQAIDLLLTGVLAGGHVLLEDVPGVGKTTLAKALARALDMEFARVQFTPDLLPTDILGAEMLNPSDGTLTFRRGPIFSHVVLADEINRASPRTQSALLEAMNEAQVTIEGHSHPLPAPFFVIATQNPVDYQGTYPLPEAQLDRFLMRLALGYPARAQELDILYAHQGRPPLETLEPASSRAELERMQSEVREVEVRPAVGEYLLALVARTREHPEIALGVSPRGALAWFRAAQARAYLDQRDYVSPDDLQALAAPVLAHRVLLTPEARYGGKSTPALLAELLGEIDVPL